MSSIASRSHCVFITGAGKGIGEACVRALLARKSEFPRLKLFLTSRTEADLNRLKALAQKHRVSCSTLVSDLSTEPTLALQEAKRFMGQVDVVLHCAGVGRFGEFLDLKKSDLEYVMKVNVEASFLLMQEAYALMKNQKKNSNGLRGQIQWITSIAAEKPFPQSSIYCMSKFAQRGLIEVMRHYAYQDSIRILDVKPGATLTPMWGKVSVAQKAKMIQPKDLAGLMLDSIRLPGTATLESLTLRPLSGDL